MAARPRQRSVLQIGLVTLVGLAAKNAILTSLAFILGVLPLALSTGAGAASPHSIGTGVIGGMLAATFIAVLFIPQFFVWTSQVGDALRRWFGGRR